MYRKISGSRFIKQLLCTTLLFLSISSPTNAIYPEDHTNYKVTSYGMNDSPSVSDLVYNNLSPRKKYLIKFKSESTKQQEKTRFLNKAKSLRSSTTAAQLHQDYKHLSMMLIELNDQEYQEYANRSDVEFIEQDQTVMLLSQERHIQPTDTPVPVEAGSWGYEALQGSQLQQQGLSGSRIKVGIMDTGIDSSHEELNVTGGISFLGHSYEDDNGHGTQMAGIISAKLNQIGVKGLAPAAELYAIKTIDHTGKGTYSDIIAGIDWAIENNVDILNMSFGGNGASKTLQDALRKAWDAGILLIAPSGNNGSSTLLYPANYGTVMSVGSFNKDFTRSSFSNYSNRLEIAAPGENIFTTDRNNHYKNTSGTSIAVAHATGAAALVWSAHPNWSNEEVRKALLNSARTITQTNELGYGLINPTDAVAGKFIRNVTLPIEILPYEPEQPGDGAHILATNISTDKTTIAVNQSATIRFWYDDQAHATQITVRTSSGSLVDSALLPSQINGTWIFYPKATGTYYIQATPIDVPDYPSPPLAITVISAAPSDNSPPIPALSLDSNDLVRFEQKRTVNYSATDNIAVEKVTLLLNDTVVSSQASSNGTYTWIPTQRGVNVFKVIAVDSSGNRAERVYQIDVHSRGHVVLIPGITGTTLFNNQNNQLVWPPIGDNPIQLLTMLAMNENGQSIFDIVPRQPISLVYGNIRNSLIAANFDVTYFGYDWRLDLDDSVAKLHSLINSLPEEKVMIVAHSMGGLIATKYAQTNAHRIDKMILLGTPFLGTAVALDMMQNGAITLDTLGEVSRNMPAIYTLLPTEKHFQLTNSPYIRAYLDWNYPKNDAYIDLKTYADTLNTFNGVSSKIPSDGLTWFNRYVHHKSEVFHKSIDNPPPVDTYYVVGNQVPTIGLLEMEFDEVRHSQPARLMFDEITDIEQHVDGDETVSISSATKNFTTPIDRTFYARGVKHKALATNPTVIQLTTNLLTNNQAPLPEGIDREPIPTETLKVHIASPVDLHIYDSVGKHMGRVSENQFENQIDTGSYYIMGSKKIALLKNGDYTLKLVGTGTGTMTYTLVYYDKQKAKKKTVKFENVAVTPTTVMTSSINSTGNLILSIDDNGDQTIDRTVKPSIVLDAKGSNDNTPPMISYEAAGTAGSKGWFTSDVQLKLLGTDAGSGIKHIQYSINKGNPQTYIGPINFNQDGTYQVTALATDNNRNQSESITFDIRIDKTAPILPQISTDTNGWTNRDVKVTLNAGDPQDIGVKLQYQLNDSGNWLSYSEPLLISTDGITKIQARAIDLAGNGSAKSTVMVNIDKKIPSTPLLKSSISDWTENNVSFSITSGIDNESGVNGVQYKVGPRGVWTDYTVPFVITADGETWIYARTIDRAGNYSEVSSLSARIDRTSPQEPTFTAGVGDWSHKNVAVTIKPGLDAGSGVLKTQYKLGMNGAWTEYTSPLQFIEEGETQVFARSIDRIGHIGSLGNITVRIDKTVPTKPTLQLSHYQWTTSNVTLTVTAGKDLLSGVLRTEYKLDSGDWIPYLGPVNITKDGETKITVRTVDRAGNISSEISAFTQIDRTPPTPPIIVASATEWYNNKVTFYLTPGTETGIGIAKSQYKIEEQGKWIDYSLTVPINNEGQTPVFARSFDKLGHISTESMTIIKIDKSAPTPPSQLSITDKTASQVTLSWGAATDSISFVKGYEIYSGITLIGYTAETNFVVKGLSSKTKYNFIVKTRDAAGNLAASTPITTTTY